MTVTPFHLDGSRLTQIDCAELASDSKKCAEDSVAAYAALSPSEADRVESGPLMKLGSPR
jgi:hypothetical protein